MSNELLALIRASTTRNVGAFRPVARASRLGNILGNNGRRALPKLAVSTLLWLAEEQFRPRVTLENAGWASTLNPQVPGSSPGGRTSAGIFALGGPLRGAKRGAIAPLMATRQVTGRCAGPRANAGPSGRALARATYESSAQLLSSWDRRWPDLRSCDQRVGPTHYSFGWVRYQRSLPPAGWRSGWPAPPSPGRHRSRRHGRQPQPCSTRRCRG